MRDGAVFGGDRIEVQGVQKCPFFVRRHQGVLHELIKRFKALNVYPYCILIALFCSIERILLSIAYTT